MKKLIALLALCTVATLSMSIAGAAEDKPDKAPAKEKKADAAKPGKARAIPYKGDVAAVDQQAKTVTVGDRVLQVTSETKIKKMEKPATLADVKVGDFATGQYREVAGKFEAASVYVKEKKAAPDKKPKNEEKKK